MAGRIVLSESSGHIQQKGLKPGTQLAPATLLRRLPGKTFVSRGAYKLLTLLDALELDVSGMTCIDAGASTGGFTDCLLQRGAKKVYAIDVGTNQLHEKLRKDPRVISMEGINLRHADSSLIPEKAHFITGDLSFISLTYIIPSLLQWLLPEGRLGLLIKPQFELGPDRTVKGVVRNAADRQKAIDKIVDFCVNTHGLSLISVLPAAIKGPKGNQEFMALFQNASVTA